jgi:hypothetical protein
MQKLSRVWQALERIPGLFAVPGYWREHCGPDFAILEPFLRPTNDMGASYPCPYPSGGDCPRKIVDYGDGEYAAICRDPWKICPNLTLPRKEVLVHALDVGAFTKVVAAPLGVRWHPPQSQGDHVWSIGLSNRRRSLNRPVSFIVLPDGARFRTAVHTLLLDTDGPFLIVAPTNQHRTAEVQQRLNARGVEFVCLDDQLFLDGDGKFVAVDPVETSDEIRPTPVPERPWIVRAFLDKHRCKVADIQKAAGVDESDYYRWRAGKLPDHYAVCRDIERVLREGLPKRLAP